MSQAIAGKSIGFIGAGVMGASLIKSLLNSSVKSNQIFISEKSEDRAKDLVSKYQVERKSISEIGQMCDVIFLAVKPQDLENTLLDLSGNLKQGTLLISIAAGKTTKLVEEYL
jgi:pyrroline-5-carboxylate reductase